MIATTMRKAAGWKPCRASAETASATGMRMCKYVSQGEVSFRLCPMAGRCERCAFAQRIEDLGS